jgi:hypothetical protein
MSRKIKIQTINAKNLEEILKENLTKLKSKDDYIDAIGDYITDKIIDAAEVIQEGDNPCDILIETECHENSNPCIENTGDAIASTNDDNSTVVNIQDIKLKKCIDKFKDIILDITTDDFTDNMSINEKNIKYSRQKGIILEEDFQTFMDVINIEKFDEITDIPEDVSKLTVKLHGNKEYLNNNNVFLELTGYYNFLINKLFIPIENINSYLFKLADKYISNYNKFEFNIPNEVIDNFAESASTNYKEIIEKLNEIDTINNNTSNDYKKCREYFNSEDTVRHLKEHYNSVDALIARKNANMDNGTRFMNEETGKPANPKAKDLVNARAIAKTLREKNITSPEELMDKILSNNTNQPGEFVISIPQDYETTMEEVNNTCNNSYEHVNHPQHYNNYDKEVIDMMLDIWGPKETAIFCKLNAFKYRMRMGTKPDNDISQDLKKEKWYLNKYHELKTKL